MTAGRLVFLMPIAAMLVRPGRYEVTNDAMLHVGQTVPVEVDAEGRCFQLNPAGERDGELARDGWTEDARAVLLERPLP